MVDAYDFLQTVLFVIISKHLKFTVHVLTDFHALRRRFQNLIIILNLKKMVNRCIRKTILSDASRLL